MLLGFYKAFQYKKYKVTWVNNETYECLNTMDLTNSLFITIHEYDDYVPLRSDSFYIIFNGTLSNKYDNITNKLNIGVYGNDLPEYLNTWKDKFYIKYSLENRELYFPLATELVPPEILHNQQNCVLKHHHHHNHICVLGNISGNGVSQIYGDIKRTCIHNYFELDNINNKDSDKRHNQLLNCNLTIIIHSTEQLNRDEIDGRLFQTISYGSFVATNSKLSATLIDDHSIYYNTNGEDLVLEALEHKHHHFTDLWKWTVMEDVKNNHTYYARVKTILWMLMRL
jgi:hypothetical protein